MTKLKVGSTIKLKETEEDLITSKSDSVHAAQAGMFYMAEQLEAANKKLFEVIRTLYPELKGYEFHYHREKKEIKITGERIIE